MWLLGVVVALAAVLFIKKIYQICTYWKAKGVAQRTAFDMLYRLIKASCMQVALSDAVKNEYDTYSNKRYSGTYQFGTATLMIRDPELIKQITVKEFEHFTDHLQFLSEDAEPLMTKHLLSLKGEKWKNMRATLSPAFTGSKMRVMFNLISEIGDQFTSYFLKDGKEVNVELKEIFARFTNDVIASCAFGVKCDSLKDRQNEFYIMGKEATNFSGFWRMMNFLILTTTPKLAKFLGLTVFSPKVANFFVSLVADTVKIREENNIVRPDIIHLLMEARKGRLKGDRPLDRQKSRFRIH